MKRRLGHLETQVLAYAQMRQVRTVRTDELARSLRLPPQQVQEVIVRLARSGLIAKVRRGLYLVPSRLPLGGTWSPDPVLAVNALMEDRDGRYQICGPNAFNRYGFDEQVPARLYVYNNRLSGERTIGSVEMTLIKLADARLGGTEEGTTAEGQKAVYSSRARTLVDAVYEWSRFSSLPRAFTWIRRELSSGRVAAADLVRNAVKYGNQATRQRIGFLLEQEGASRSSLAALRRSLGPSPSVTPWNPAGPKRGTVDHRWGVILNEAQ
jgi:predicted transcriptional regulator of viral defense system